jgi:hypothetical protein
MAKAKGAQQDQMRHPLAYDREGGTYASIQNSSTSVAALVLVLTAYEQQQMTNQRIRMTVVAKE